MNSGRSCKSTTDYTVHQLSRTTRAVEAALPRTSLTIILSTHKENLIRARQATIRTLRVIPAFFVLPKPGQTLLIA